MNQNVFDIFNQSPYIFYFLVVDEFLDISLPQLKNFHLIYAYKNENIKNLKNPYFCLEEQKTTLSAKNSGKLLSHPKVINYIKKNSNGLQPIIIPFKPSSKIEHLCKKNNWINATVSAKINRFLEDKNQFFSFCQKNKLPTIPSKIDTFTKINFEKYQKEYGQKLVLQSHFGWAGNSTFCSDNWENIKNSFTTNILVKFSPFISGYSLTNNCCLTQNGLAQSPLALQFTGIKPLTNNPFATVGRQWPSMAPKNITKKIEKITNDFSKSIKKINYQGFFGLDFLVDRNGKVYLLECNPRLTASFAFYTQIEIQKKLFPLFLLHLSQFIKISSIPKTNQIQKRLNSTNITGTELTQKNNTKTIAKYQQNDPITFQTENITIPQKIIDQLHV
jgi:predicted ATP-grasp superfamily ATP-dependent carboligase